VSSASFGPCFFGTGHGPSSAKDQVSARRLSIKRQQYYVSVLSFVMSASSGKNLPAIREEPPRY